MKRKILSLLLCLTMVAGMLPTALADQDGEDQTLSQEPQQVQEAVLDETPQEEEPVLDEDLQEEAPVQLAGAAPFAVTGGQEGTDWTVTDGSVLEILSDTDMTVKGGSVTTSSEGATVDPVQGRIWVKDGITANLTFEALYLQAPDYQPAVRVEKGSTLNLTLGSDTASAAAAILTGGKGRAGIEVPETAALKIVDGGTLKVTAGEKDSSYKGAAIGASAKTASGAGHEYEDGVGTIEIAGGTVVASGAGSAEGPGIGGANLAGNHSTEIGTIRITGGAVEAKGNPGIGAAYATTGSIEITGGTVTAAYWGSAGGILAPGDGITISGGTVTTSGNGAPGLGGDGSTVTIRNEGTQVTVNGTGADGTALGGKKSAAVNIEGGSVHVEYTTAAVDNTVGIGSSQGSADSRSTVNISGGKVTATGGAGIGGDFCDVTISGGEVTAQGKGGAGIGGNCYQPALKNTYYGTVTITGGRVTAIGGYEPIGKNSSGAGIGTAGDGRAATQSFGPGAAITITGGTVYAIGLGSAEGIGGGFQTTDSPGLGAGTGWFSTTDDNGPGSALIVTDSIGDGFDLESPGDHSGLFLLGAAYDTDGGSFTKYGTGKVLGAPVLERDLTLPLGRETNDAALEIPQGASLTVEEGYTLTTGGSISGTSTQAGTDVTNSGTFHCKGTLVTDLGGSFTNGATGVFNWYGTVTGPMDTTAEGNVVNYPSTVEIAADNAAPTYGSQVTFTATVSREVKDSNADIAAAAGTVDFYLDGAEEPFASQTATLDETSKTLTASAAVYTLGEEWKANSTHTVTARYHGGEGVNGETRDPKAQQLPAVTAKGAEVTVAPKSLTNDMIAALTPDSYTFDGQAKEPAVTMTDTVNGQNAITAADYTVAYSDNVNAGTATVTVTGQGNYTGTAAKTFTINKAASDPAAVTVTKNLYYQKANQVQVDLAAEGSLPENRGTTTCSVSASDASSILDGTPSETDGVLTFATKAGQVDQTAAITVTAVMQNYTDVTYTVNVTLKDKALLTVTGVSVEGVTEGKRTYNGQAAAATGTPAAANGASTYTGEFDYKWYSVTEGADDALLNAAPVKAGSYKLVVSIPDSDETYRGQQEIPFTIEKATLTVAPGTYKITKVYDGTAAAGAGAGELALTGVCGEDSVTVTPTPGVYGSKDVGESTVSAALVLSGDEGNYQLAAQTVDVPASITAKAITINAATVADKDYDGTAAATVSAVTFHDVVNNETLAKDTDYEATAAFTDPKAGSGKTANITVTLKNRNYSLENSQTTATAAIAKAAAPASADLEVDVANRFAKTYAVNLSKALGAPAEGCEYGAVTYSAANTTDTGSILNTPVSITDGVLSLDVKNIDSDTEAPSAAAVTVKAVSENYADVTFTVKVNTVNRTVPVGAPTVTGELTYGQSLSTLTLSGTMKAGAAEDAAEDAAEVSGSFAWDAPDSTPAVADAQAGWTFTPDDAETYLEVSGQAAITVAKAVPAGKPSVAAVTAGGKTLAEAVLSGAFTNPYSQAEVAGTLAWDDALTTEVTANKAYAWTFTPEDTANYEPAAGTLTPWVRSSGGSVGGGAAAPETTTTTNEDGSTTRITTDKATGTVTETTTWPDGSVKVVETKKDGTVTETYAGADGSKTETVTNPDGSMTTDVTTADGVKVQVAKSAEGRVETSVTLPQTAEDATVALPVAAKAPEDTQIQVTTDVPAKLVAPVLEADEATVAVIVDEEGNEKIVQASVLTEEGMVIPVSGSATVKLVDNRKDFDDVDQDIWYAKSVTFVSAREMLVGVGEKSFAPETVTTRAMLMTILARYDGVDTAGGQNWYEKGMSWAVEQGITDGSDPESVITREQLVTMLYRYAGQPQTGGSIGSFRDADSVSAYARAALEWAVEQGIINGKGDGTLDPQGSATRAEMAAMLQRFCAAMMK